jgi:phosphoglycolate phosphatase
VLTHVVFDFDGTLVDSQEVALRLYNEVAAREGYGRLGPDNLERMRALSVLERCRALGVPLHRLPGLMVQVGRAYRSALRSLEFQPGVPRLMRGLSERGLRLAIVSTNDAGNIRAFLRLRGAEAWVDEVHCSSSVFGKGRLLRALMRRRGLGPEQVVYVGDEARDVEAARGVGVKSIAALWGFDAEARLREAGPDALAARPEDVVGCVEGWLAPAARAGATEGRG